MKCCQVLILSINTIVNLFAWVITKNSFNIKSESFYYIQAPDITLSIVHCYSRCDFYSQRRQQASIKCHNYNKSHFNPLPAVKSRYQYQGSVHCLKSEPRVVLMGVSPVVIDNGYVIVYTVNIASTRPTTTAVV